LPDGPDEVVVNQALLDEGVRVGDSVELPEVDGPREIVGVGRDATHRTLPVLAGPRGSLMAERPDDVRYLVDGPEITWDDVPALNDLGILVTSRAVLLDPPAGVQEEWDYDQGYVQDTVSVGILIAVMVLVEVVLLAGPAFAVNARQHTRTVALVALNGGTPAQSRRVVLASALVLGVVATGLGLVAGLGVARGVLGLVQRMDPTWFGPFDVPWGWLLVVAAFGTASALMAAAVPAWTSARQDVARVLAGRRGDAAPRRGLPVLGLVLLGLGVLGVAAGAMGTAGGSGTLVLAGSIVVAVLGMALVVPVAIQLVAGLAARWPLAARYATRDAARHRTRSVPAVAAVAATVAGVVVIGIASSSDYKEREETYEASAPMGTSVITRYEEILPGQEVPATTDPFPALAQVVAEEVPSAQVDQVYGLSSVEGDQQVSWSVKRPGEDWWFESSFIGVGPMVVVADDASGLALTDAEATAVDAALSSGKAVVFTDEKVEEVDLSAERWRPGVDEYDVDVETTFAAVAVDVEGFAPAQAVLPRSLTTEHSLPVVVQALRLPDGLSRAEEKAVEERIASVDPDASVYTERGYETPPEEAIANLVLWGVGALLMLAGTLTATFLALGDARPDLATLAAVGAAPRTRRQVGAWYALVLAGIGTVMGVAVGFVPGLAMAYALTSEGGYVEGEAVGPFFDVPWLLIASVVVVLPLLAAGVVWVSTRSRLPMVARID
ncbi:MAG: FtsX-like permease family protein, partial [Nocardioides sp.]|uniref:FtsX-like permease family protein n=1 Tax=Nocardioides sp. TaxID=35761 RepID=UPI003EFE250F